MSFPADVRERALVAAARHCCVCRRFKGVSVEVHHIVPESEGGSNDDENAIVLCFDCHADAGHYPKHSRGTRYSRQELRRARAAWHELPTSRVRPSRSIVMNHESTIVLKVMRAR